MAARRHALSQLHHLPFRSAHAERGEYVCDPHELSPCQKIK
jgi:hypothetical protein